jgi:hypothetical protein
LVRKSGAAFVQVDQHAAIFAPRSAAGFAHQALAIAAGGAENIAIEAAGVHADQDVFGAGHVAAHQRQVVFGVELAGVGDGAEGAEFGIEEPSPARRRKRSVFMR